MILATSKVLIVLCLRKFFCEMKKTFSPMNPPARDVEWPLYISTFSNFNKNQCQKSTSIKWPNWWYNQSAQFWKDIVSSSFNFLPCLGYDIFEVNAHFTPLTPGMLRGELCGKLKFQRFFSKKKGLVKSLIFWWNSLVRISRCKIKDCCFHEFCVTF